jgi:hypothetical protein
VILAESEGSHFAALKQERPLFKTDDADNKEDFAEQRHHIASCERNLRLVDNFCLLRLELREFCAVTLSTAAGTEGVLRCYIE